VTTTEAGTPPFLFGPEHQAFEESVWALARKEFYDGYLERGTSDEMCWPQLKTLGRHKLLGLNLPEEVGGQDADPVSIGLACEQMARADFNVSYLIFGSLLARGLFTDLPAEVSYPVLKKLVDGDEVISLALTEPRGGSDASGTTVRARPEDGGYRLFGEKSSITLGAFATNAIVVATVDPALRSRGTRRFLVSLDDPTISRQRFKDVGFRPLSRVALTFDGTFVPDSHELKSDTSGVAAQLGDFDLTRALLGLMVLGAARRAIDTTIEWVRQREVFGQPISRYQGVSFTLAEHDTQLEAARWLCYRTLALRAANLPHAREAAMCKWWCPQLAVRAINDCIVLHGHIGWSAEMPLQQLLLDVSGLQIGDGTPQIQKLVIARHLIGRDFTG
jgi:cyclohexanecarboxyl-CoA dehydrogenase